MLNGVSKLNLDAKGRLAIPSRYRERLLQDCGGRLVVTLDQERRMVIYPHNEWKQVEDKLVKLSISKAAVKLKRLILGHAEDCDMDKNGRISLPLYLREKNKLERQVVLIGIGNKFEVWNEESWNDEWNDEEELELPEELAALSL